MLDKIKSILAALFILVAGLGLWGYSRTRNRAKEEEIEKDAVEQLDRLAKQLRARDAKGMREDALKWADKWGK